MEQADAKLSPRMKDAQLKSVLDRCRMDVERWRPCVW